MGKYGQAAVNAVKFIQNKVAVTPLEAWEKATKDIFGEGTWGQVKGCPRNSFLGLCEEGLIRGIQKGNYSRSQKNKMYAIKAVELIRNNSMLAADLTTLWKHVIDGKRISHNYQMDVVVSLWESNLIEP